jgi:DNA polymerase-3 subunit delta'
VEAAAELRSWIALRPLGRFKAVLVDDADRLGDKTADMLLKALEEPPAYARFLLVSGRPQDVRPTIVSRCQRLEFRPLDADRMRGVLKGLNLDDDDRALLATVAAGRPGTALGLAEGKRLQAVARHISALEKALKAGVAERMVYANDDEGITDIVSWWLAYVHGQLARRPELAAIGHGLVDLHRTVSEPGYNRRLAVEHFLLSVTP